MTFSTIDDDKKSETQSFSSDWKMSINNTLSKAFQWYGEFIGLHPLPFVLIPILITIPCGYLIFRNFAINNDLQFLFSPIGAPSVAIELAAENRYNLIAPRTLPPNATMNCTTGEIKLPMATASPSRQIRTTAPPIILAEKPPKLITKGHFVDILIQRTDGGNILEPNITDHYFFVYDYFFNKLNFTYKNQTFITRNLCDPIGPHVPYCWRPYSELKFFTSLYYDPTLASDPNIQFTYPILKIFERTVPIFFLLNGVTKHPVTQRILSAKVVRMVIVITWNQVPENVADETTAKFKEFALALENYYTKVEDPIFTFFLSHSAAAELAIPAAAKEAMPMFGVSLCLLLAFIVLSNIRSPITTSKPLEAFIGLLNPLMAIITTVGILLSVNSVQYPMFPLLAAMPFLIAAIGVDDMFVLVSGWHETDPLLPAHKRLGMVMSEAGVSVMITSVINVISFATCVSQDTRGVSIFGLYASLGLAIEYLYQMTFFMGVMAYGARLEKIARRSLHSAEASERRRTKISSLTDAAKEKWKKSLAKVETFLTQPELYKHKVSALAGLRVLVLIFFVIYMYFALIGCVTIQPDFSIKKVLPKESYYYKFLTLQQETVAREVYPAHIYIMNPPDFRDENQTILFHEFVKNLESIKNYAVGSRSTELWLTPYEDFRETADVSTEDYYRDLQSRWLTIDTFSFWSYQLRFGNTAACDKPLQAFSFFVHYNNLTTFNDVIKLVDGLRNVTNNVSYAQFEPVAFNPLSLIVDQVSWQKKNKF